MSGAIHALLGFPPEPFKTPLSPPRQPPARKPFGSRRRRRRRRRKSRRDMALYPLAFASRRALHLVADRSATRSLAKQPLEGPRRSRANPNTDNVRILRELVYRRVFLLSFFLSFFLSAWSVTRVRTLINFVCVPRPLTNF